MLHTSDRYMQTGWMLAGMFGLLFVIATVFEQQTYRGMVYFDVPLLPQRALHVHIGTRSGIDRRPTEARMFSSSATPRVTTPRIAMWYRHRPAGINRLLLHLHLPTWPLGALAAATTASTLGYPWLRRRVDAARSPG